MKAGYIGATGAAIGILACMSAVAAPNMTRGEEQAQAEYEAAIGLQPDIGNGRRLFRTCTICHSPEGWGTEDGAYPQIAGQLASVVIQQLADIRARNRDNPTMFPFTDPRHFGGAQNIADVAAYIEQLPMSPHNGRGPGIDLTHGEQVYRDECAECHGDHGEGNREDHTPALYGQHYHYLVRQFEWIRIGKRRNADKKMVKQVQHFTPRDTQAVMDYVSRLQPPHDKRAEEGWTNPDFPNFVRRPWMR